MDSYYVALGHLNSYSNKINIYTDGSQMNDRTGVGYYMNDEEWNGYKRLEEGI